MNTTKEQTQFAAAVFVYEDDGWYGKKYRYFIDGFDSKSDAKKALSRMKKYIKTNILDRSSRIGVTEIGVLSQMETYRYTSLGPSWSATNIAINLVDYSEFSKSEEIRLEENRIERAQMKEFRESRKNLKKYQKH